MDSVREIDLCHNKYLNTILCNFECLKISEFVKKNDVKNKYT